MKKSFSTVLLACFLVLALVSCATGTSGSSAEPKKGKVTLTLNGVATDYPSLQSAVAAIPAGGEGFIVLNQSFNVSSTIDIADITVNITDCGSDIVITDKTAGSDTTNSLFLIAGKGKLSIEGSASGTITLKGAGEDFEDNKRTMFNVGDQYGDTSRDACLRLGKGVVVEGIYSKYSGAVARGYGQFVFDGCTIRNNTATVNGCMLCLYGTAVINDGIFENNTCGGNGGLIQVTNTDDVSLIVNGGIFRNNSGGTLGSIINTYAKSYLEINGGTFENNAASGANANGACIYCVGTSVINAGTFSGNTPYDISVIGSTNIGAAVSAANINK